MEQIAKAAGMEESESANDDKKDRKRLKVTE